LKKYCSSAPLTYIIDYSLNHLENPRFLEAVKQSRPHLLHVGTADLVFQSMLGPFKLKGSYSRYELLKPDAVPSEERRVREYVRTIRESGVETVIPYICSIFIFGDHEKRTGFWEFYDNWENYPGLPEKPARDPVEWTYVRRMERDIQVYEPCVNDPDWRSWLRLVALKAAELGYNGVFVDVNATRCGCDRCRKLFYRYLVKRYGQEKVAELFGFTSPGNTRLGGKDEGLLTLETNMFRAWSFASLFSEIREACKGLVLPNCWPMSTIDALARRRGNGHDPEIWASSVEWLMFEEFQSPGTYCPCGQIVNDHVLQYKYALAVGVRPAVLVYMASDEVSCRLSNAEALAGGGGAFVQPGVQGHGAIRTVRRFVEEHRGLLEGLREYGEVALAFLTDQHMRGNVDHLVQAYHLRRYLSDRHYAYSIVARDQLRLDILSKFKAVILPEAKYLGEEKAEALMRYVEQGGLLVTTGETGRYDYFGRRLEAPLLQEGRYGKGRIVNARFKELVPVREFELFLLKEAEYIDKKAVMEKCREAHEVGLCRPKGGDRLAQLLGEAGVKPLLKNAPAQLRVNVFIGDEAMVAHLVNYSLDVAERRLTSVENVSLRLPVNRGVEARAYGFEESFSLDLRRHSGFAEIRIPEIRDYLMVVVHLRYPA